MSKEAIKVVKLLSGEELIGKFVSGHSGPELLLNDVLSLNYVPQEGGRLGFVFGPYSPLTVGPKPINQDHITFVADPNDQLAEAYNRATSKIVTPSKELILG